MTAPGLRQLLVGWVTLGVLVGCSVARRADEAQPPAPARPVVLPSVVAPPQAEGLDGSAGLPGPSACSAVTATLSKQLAVKVTAKPFSWNDGGLPALDLCTLVLDGRSVTVGISAHTELEQEVGDRRDHLGPELPESANHGDAIVVQPGHQLVKRHPRTPSASALRRRTMV